MCKLSSLVINLLSLIYVAFVENWLQCNLIDLWGGRLPEVKKQKNNPNLKPQRWSWSLTRGGCLWEVLITVFDWEVKKEFTKWSLRRGGRLREVVAQRGSTVSKLTLSAKLFKQVLVRWFKSFTEVRLAQSVASFDSRSVRWMTLVRLRCQNLSFRSVFVMSGSGDRVNYSWRKAVFFSNVRFTATPTQTKTSSHRD